MCCFRYVVTGKTNSTGSSVGCEYKAPLFIYYFVNTQYFRLVQAENSSLIVNVQSYFLFFFTIEYYKLNSGYYEC